MKLYLKPKFYYLCVSLFCIDSKIYGRISLLEARGFGKGRKGYALAAEKVYLCTGVGEFVPTYDPLKNKFGCMAQSLYLEHRLKVLVSF